MSRILADRLNPWLTTLLYPSQHCGIRGQTVFEALATVRDAIAYAEYSRSKLCLLSLDFKEAFDYITHSYLFNLLKTYGFSPRFQQRIRDMCKNAMSCIKINGHISNPVPFKCSIRQGCPLSMQLFALCQIHYSLTTLENMLTGIHIFRRPAKTAVLAYADDVTLHVTSPQDTPRIKYAIEQYEAASGARINIRKSRAMEVSFGDRSINIKDIPYHTEMKILGINFTNSPPVLP